MKPKIKPSFAFVVDGQTEAWYLQMLKRNERNINIAIKPELAQKKSLEAQYKQVCEMSLYYLDVFWVMDLDTIIKEQRDNAKSKSSAELAKYVKALPNNAHFIPNVPCLEYWLLLHFKQTSKFYPSYKELSRDLKHIQVLSDYEKTAKYYTGTNDIYKRLKPYLAQAMVNAALLPEIDFANLEKGVCKMHKIIQALTPTCHRR